MRRLKLAPNILIRFPGCQFQNVAPDIRFCYTTRMGATKTFNSMLPDDQMREHLATGNSLVFEGLADDWQKLERQVERLGFGERFVVSQRRGIHGDLTKVSRASDGRKSL